MAIIKVPRSDDTSAFVLLNIESSADHSLNAKVVGTDGVGAFVLQLKPALASRALAPKSSCNHDDWIAILNSVLLDGLTPDDIEVTATVEDEANIQVVFRKTFGEGLKQRLGSLTLKFDDGEAIELLDWCAALATRASQQLSDLQREKDKVRKLVQETDELVKAKAEAEKEVMGKCLRLVNSKKEKIQELQQRLSRYEKGDPPVGEPMQVEEEEAPQPAKRVRGKAAAKGKGKEKEASPVKSTLPRRGKRAAPEPEPEEEEEEPTKEENENGEDVDMDEDGVETEGETEGEDTPSDHSVEDEVPQVRTRAESQTQSQGGHERSRKDVSPPKEAEHEAPHVTTRAAAHTHGHKKATAKDDGSETESDDEL